MKERKVVKTFLEYYRHRKKRGFILKLDLEKAYDCTNWDFLDYIMARKGFGSKWRTWIHCCVASSHFSSLVTGSAKGFFPSFRGLRQGDPLSPFLFTMVADAFSQMLKNGEKSNLIQGFRIGKESIPITYLQYADATLLFLDGGENHLINLSL